MGGSDPSDVGHQTPHLMWGIIPPPPPMMWDIRPPIAPANLVKIRFPIWSLPVRQLLTHDVSDPHYPEMAQICGGSDPPLMWDIRPPTLTPHIFWSKTVKIRPLQNHSQCTPHSTRGSDFEFFAILDVPLGFGPSTAGLSGF